MMKSATYPDLFPVMMDWENPYLDACVDAIQPKADVLEVGFSSHHTADRIESYRPTTHTIIEEMPLKAQAATLWATNRPHVRVIEAPWQKALPELKAFDSIFFASGPLNSDKACAQEIHMGNVLLSKGKKTLQDAYLRLPFLKTITYTQEDLDAFFASLENPTPKMLLRFLCDLKRGEHITQDLFNHTCKQLTDRKILTTQQIQDYAYSAPKPLPQQQEELLPFLDLCLQGNHLKYDGLISCYLCDAISKLEDEEFFQKVILNPFLEYRERTLSLEVPQEYRHCRQSQALVISIQNKKHA